MPYTFTLTATIPASPEEIYQAWLDSIGHSEMTGSEATMSDEVGAEVSAWDGYISGRNLELIPGERIVQSWRTTEFGDEEEDSVITVVLQGTEEGTLLTLDHSNVPDEHKGYEEGGWQSNYFEPMIAYFTELKEDIAEPAPHQGVPKKPGKRSAKSAGKKTAGKKAAGKRAAPRKASPSKKAAPKGKSRAKARATTARTRAKSSARKAARGKRR
jgi:uncharacterized protein YndB with AHSA1/START domain